MKTTSQDQLFDQLRALSFFQPLAEGPLRWLCEHASWVEFTSGEVVFLEGEHVSGLHVVEQGWLKIVKTSLDGREHVLRLIGPGEAFNESGVFANRPTPATAIALEPAGIWLLRREAILHLLHEQPEFAQQLIAGMAGRIIDLVEAVADLSLRPVASRLARLILQDSQDGVLPRPRWYTQSELAARIGTVPDVVQRALRTLEIGGLIAIDRHQIRIRDRAALEELAS